jgi:hypothetical protein
VRNERVLQGSVYEQVITFSRSDADSRLKVNVEVSGDPMLLEWVKLPPPDELVMNEGEKTLPMTVKVQVPVTAEARKYKGNLFASTSPANGNGGLKGGEVAINLGAHIEVDLTVVSEPILDYVVRSVSAPLEIKVGDPLIFEFRIENLGNQDITALEGMIDIIERRSGNVYKSIQLSEFPQAIKAYDSGRFAVEFPDLKLPEGEYWLDVKIMKDGQVHYENRLYVYVAKPKPVALEEEVKAPKVITPVSVVRNPVLLFGMIALLLGVMVVLVATAVRKKKRHES